MEVTMFNSGFTRTAWLKVGSLSLVTGLVTMCGVEAHETQLGWRYPFACCSDRDCRVVSDAAVSEGPEGYVIGVTGERLSYTDKRVRNSPDGVFHWCSVAGKDNTRTICLFVPPRSF